MKITEYVEKNEFMGAGLPQGKTIIELATTEIEERNEKDDEGKPVKKWVVGLGENKYFIPRTVMQKIQEAHRQGKKSVEIVRQGTGKTDTKYTVLGI